MKVIEGADFCLVRMICQQGRILVANLRKTVVWDDEIRHSVGWRRGREGLELGKGIDLESQFLVFIVFNVYCNSVWCFHVGCQSLMSYSMLDR